MGPGLPDILCLRPRVLFVGINPGLRSGATGHHFAGRGNPFWRLLHATGLTPRLLAPEEDGLLPTWGLALTNLCPRTTRTAAELSRAELAAGAAALRAKVERLEPTRVAFVGLSVHRAVLGPRATPGPGAVPETLAGARLFVLPNPSGLNASYPGFEDKRVWFERLRAALDADGPDAPPPHPSG